MEVIPIKTEYFNEGESLINFIYKYVPSLKDGDVLVITSKIIALAQGRTHDNIEDKERIIPSANEGFMAKPSK